MASIGTGSAIDELDWDHTAEGLENTPLICNSRRLSHQSDLRPQQWNNSKNFYLSVRQVQQLLTNLEEAELILKNSFPELHEESQPSWIFQLFSCGWCEGTLIKKVNNNITLFSIILQTFTLIVLSVTDSIHKADSRVLISVSAVLMIIFQLINLVMVLFTCIQIGKDIFHRHIHFSQLAQSYISTILLFTGFYTVIYRLEPASWKFIQEDLSANPVQVVVLYCKFLFFSVSTATLCGSDNSLPKEWYNCLLVAFQMLLSFMYFASILGSAMSLSTKFYPNHQVERPSRHITESGSSRISHSSQLAAGFTDMSMYHSLFREEKQKESYGAINEK